MNVNQARFSRRAAGLFSALTLLLLASCSPKSIYRFMADDGSTPQTAYQVYADLQDSATSFNSKAVLVDGQAIDGFTGGVTWGAEKEASSGLITRIMTPPGDAFKSMVNGLSEDNQKAFLQDFFKNYVKNANGYRTYKTEEGVRVDFASDVTDIDGNAKLIDMEQFRGVDWDNADLDTLKSKWNQWVDMTDNRPMSFVKPSVRMKLYKGNLPGLDSSHNLKPSSNWGYSDWMPTWGKAQKYIRDAHGHGGGRGGGWEINFVPLNTYGEFEEMVMWFRTTLKNAGKLFQAPGHQRMVFRAHPDLNEAKLAETYRMIQALIVVDGIKGKTGIEKASYKSVQSDSGLASLNTSRGVIRLEGPRWGAGTHGIEFRAGTKDINAARFYQTVLASRVATNDFSGMADIGDYPLYDGRYSWSASDLASRFDVDEEVAQRAINNIQSANIKPSYTLPFWSWTDENVSWISSTKKKFIKSLTKDFIIQCAELENAGESEVRQLMRSWTKSTGLSQEIRNYLKPKRAAETTGDLLHFTPVEGRPVLPNVVDVNNIDLGIEYSGKFPLRVDAQLIARSEMPDNKQAWVQTRIDMTPEERKAVIEKVAKDLLEELGGSGEPAFVEDAGGHGHGLEVAYEIRDSQNRKWVVEWDGIGRSYTPDGEVVDGSVRGGSIELVTPKFVPQVEEMDAVYKAFEKNNILPAIQSGGGHINIDLAPFEGKPKELAKFMALFHENRGIISLMFQYVNRLKSAEPIDIDPDLARKLGNFQGSEEELKKLLYNKRYFNERYGRKTRYNQLDMSAYYQDVIPEKLITDDFDIASPTDPWRRTFRVDPRIRKAEFRLFNAPRDSMESALQIKLVRAMLHKALNEPGEVSGSVQKVDHMAYLKNPEKAYQDLQKMCDDLGLDINDYRPAVAEGLSDTDLASRSVFFETLDEKLALHPKQPAWGNAVDPRSADNAISSEGRAWTPGPEDQQNTITNEHRIRAAREAERRRAQLVPEGRVIQGDFRRTDSCVDAAGAFL